MPCCRSNSPETQVRGIVTVCPCTARVSVLHLRRVRSALTLDVYLLHLVDLGDGLSELLCELPELLSARRAETHQLLLLGGERAHHGDAVGVV